MTGAPELIEITARLGSGWPHCTGQQYNTRRFVDRPAAASWLATIDALPSHHVLVRIRTSPLQWTDATDTLAAELRAEAPGLRCCGCGITPAPAGACPNCGSHARILDHDKDPDE